MNVVYGRLQSDHECITILDKISKFFASVFILEFTVLLILLSILTNRLMTKKRVFHHGASTPNFRSGVCILILIVLIFSLSFPLRILNDFFFISVREDSSTYWSMMYD